MPQRAWACERGGLTWQRRVQGITVRIGEQDSADTGATVSYGAPTIIAPDTGADVVRVLLACLWAMSLVHWQARDYVGVCCTDAR